MRFAAKRNRMCDSPELLKKLDELIKILQPSPLKTATNQTILMNDNQPWVVDYKDFKHIFMWLPTQLTLVMGEYGQGTVQAQVWINLGLRPGTKIVTSGQSSATPIILHFTDEVVP